MSIRRIATGTLASYLNTGISILSNFILVPMYLYYLGKEQYGLWIVVLSMVSYLGLSNLGIAQIISNLVAGANAKKDNAGIRTIVATGFWLYTAIIFILSVIVAGMAIFIPLNSLFKIAGGLEKVVTPVFVISSVFFLMQLPLTIFRVTLRSLDLIYKEQLFAVIFTIVQFFGVLIILLLKVGIVGLSVVYGITGILSGLMLLIYLRKIIPDISISIKLIDLKLVRELVRPGIFFFILQLSGGLVFGTNNIIIGSVLGAAAVAPFAVVFRFLMILSGIPGVFTSNMLPSITSFYASSDRQQLSEIYKNALNFCFGFGFIVLCLLISVGPDLMIKWIGIDNYVGSSVFYVVICLVFVQIVLWPADAVLMGTTQHIGYAKMAILEGVVNIVLSIWWIKTWGIIGVAAATLAARITTNGWFMFYRAYAITGVGAKGITVNILRLFIVPVSGALIVGYALNHMPFTGWNKIIINSTNICAIFSILFYFFSLSTNRRIKINKLIGDYFGIRAR